MQVRVIFHFNYIFFTKCYLRGDDYHIWFSELVVNVYTCMTEQSITNKETGTERKKHTGNLWFKRKKSRLLNHMWTSSWEGTQAHHLYERWLLQSEIPNRDSIALYRKQPGRAGSGRESGDQRPKRCSGPSAERMGRHHDAAYVAGRAKVT
jgi:hypothetical protein